MSPVNADQLDAATRARIGLPPTRRAKPAPTKTGSAGWNLVCRACGYEPAGATAADRHSAQEGHHRWQYTLGEIHR